MARRRTRIGRALDHIAGSPAGSFFYRRIAPPIDKVIMPLTRGRIRLSLHKPTCLLHTIGARSGRPRTSPILYLRDGENVVVIASNGGVPEHPAWYHNLRAHPECEVSINGRTRRYAARQAEGEERERLWALGLETYEGWMDYQSRTDRRIPVMVLEPRYDTGVAGPRA